MRIIRDIVDIVEGLEKGISEELVHLLDFKFQEYYMERHYGGITEVAELGISERDEDSAVSD